jgi:hypothetical protein
MPVLHPHELLSTVAHFGTEAVSGLQRTRQVIVPSIKETKLTLSPRWSSLPVAGNQPSPV